MNDREILAALVKGVLEQLQNVNAIKLPRDRLLTENIPNLQTSWDKDYLTLWIEGDNEEGESDSQGGDAQE